METGASVRVSNTPSSWQSGTWVFLYTIPEVLYKHSQDAANRPHVCQQTYKENGATVVGSIKQFRFVWEITI